MAGATAVTDVDQEFIEECTRAYGGPREEALWSSWVEGCIGKVAKKLHRRLLVVCKYRLLVIKKAGLFSKNALEKDLAWFDLVEIREQAKEFLALDFRTAGLPTQSSTLTSWNTVQAQSGSISFAPPTTTDTQMVGPFGPALPALNPDLTVHVKTSSDRLAALIAQIRTCQRNMSWGIPDSLTLKLSVYGDLVQDLPPLTPSFAAHFEPAYLGRCSTLSKPSSELFLRRVSDLSSEGIQTLQLDRVPGCDPKSDSQVTLQPAVAALAHNTYFTSFISRDVIWDQSDAAALGALTRMNTTLLQLTISRASLSDFSEMAYGLACNPGHKIIHLDLSNNSLNDRTVQALTDALAVYPHALKVLNLENCGISPKSLQFLFDGAFCKNYGMSLSIQELYLGGNNMGAEGSAGFDKWLDQVKSYAQLERLSIASVNAVNVGTLCKFITPCAPKLLWLDLSNNRIEDTDLPFIQTLFAALHAHAAPNPPPEDIDTPHAFLPVTVKLSNSQLSIRGLQTVLQTLRSNTIAKNIALDLSANSAIDEKSMVILGPDLVACTAITCLSVAECRLKLRGIQQLLAQLPPYVTELYLDDTFAGSETEELSTALGRWLATTPIQRLSLRGSKNAHLRRALVPLFSYLNTSLTLRHLHLDYNYMGDYGMFKLQEALRVNTKLLEVTLDRNQVTVSGFDALLSGIKRNKTLVSVGQPHVDLEKARSLLTSERRQIDLHTVWYQIQEELSRNNPNSPLPKPTLRTVEDHLRQGISSLALEPLASLPSFLTTASASSRMTQKPSTRPATAILSSPAEPVPSPPTAVPPTPQNISTQVQSEYPYDLDSLPPPPMEAPPPPPPT